MRNDCLTELDLVQILEGRADPTRLVSIREHLVACHSCREALAALTRLSDDAEIAAEVARLDAGRDRPAIGLRHWGQIAAVIGLIAILVPWHRLRDHDPEDPTHRAPATAATGAPTPLEPSGEVTAPSLLRWSSASGVIDYRAVLYDTQGNVLLEREVSAPDTSIALPLSLPLIPGGTYFWKVEGRTGADRWTASGLTEFRLVPGKP